MENIRRYFSAFFLVIIFSAAYLYSNIVHAACSPYTGFATINELFHKSQNNRPTEYFVEVKALDPSIISSGGYTGWTINLCSQSAGGCTGAISLSQATVNNSVYLVLDENDVNQVIEPFSGPDKGLHMASAFGVVKKHSGVMTVSSDAEKGSVFSIYLPANSA